MKHSVVFVLAAVACTEPEPTLEPVYATDQCTKNGCGDNSPEIRGVYFGELNELPFIPNPEGVAITSVLSGGDEPMLLHVIGDRLVGLDADAPAVTLAAGAALVNTRIRVTLHGEEFEIRISDWYAAPDLFWAEPAVEGAVITTEYYDFVYRPLDADEEKPLCSEALNGTDMIHAFVFTGDRYDPDTKEITTGLGAFHWFNIACFGSATAKMHLTGHTAAAASALGIVPRTLNQRRAMLNAWTSNVCGTGRAFTVQGEHLVMREFGDLIPHDHPSSWVDGDPPETYEAIWGPRGAVCLDTHRLEEGDNADRYILDRIARECRLPPKCSDLVGFPGSWKAHGFVFTGNPPPEEEEEP